MIVLGILALIAGISMSAFSNVKNSQALDRDTDAIVATLRQARSQTLVSLNSTNYGVHFASSQFTLFAGGTYSANASGNQVFNMTGSDTIVTISLAGGGNDIIFNRLSGETAQNGTITVSSSSAGRSRAVTIYKTGLIEFQ